MTKKRAPELTPFTEEQAEILDELQEQIRALQDVAYGCLSVLMEHGLTGLGVHDRGRTVMERAAVMVVLNEAGQAGLVVE